MGYIGGISYKPLTSLLLTSWDIQVEVLVGISDKIPTSWALFKKIGKKSGDMYVTYPPKPSKIKW